MDLMIFVGTLFDGNFAKEVAATRNINISFINEKNDIKKQTNDVLFETKDKACRYIIFNINQYSNTADEIVKEVKGIAAATGAEIIIYAPLFSPRSAVVRELYDNDIKNFIFEGDSSNKKNQLEKIMTGYYQKNQRKEILEIEKRKEEDAKLKENFKTIGVCGSLHRIGTTTQAIQIAKYLTLKGYKVCLIELNENKYLDYDMQMGKKKNISYVEKIKEWFVVEKEDEELGMIKAFNLDMYYKEDKLNEIIQKGYDYYIYDYGSYQDQNFNRVSFLKDDIKIITVGSSVTELEITKEVAASYNYKEALLLFSFTGKEERESIMEMMGSISTENSNKNNKDRCFFCEFAEDPFLLRDVKVYEEMIKVEDVSAKTFEETKKKKTLFKRKARK